VPHILRFLRWSGRIVLVLYFVLGLTWLGLRYAVLPQIARWHDVIAEQLSQALGAQVQLGSIKAQWLGLHPQLTLYEVSIQDPQHGEHLELPYLHATLSWRSLSAQRLQFTRLEVVGLDVTVRRDAQGNLWVLDQALGQLADPAVRLQSPGAETPSGTAHTVPAVFAAPPAAVLWLLSQQWVDFSDVTLRWVDEQRQAPPLVLHRAQLQIRKHGDRHQVALAVSPPSDLARAVDVRAEVRIGDSLTALLDVSQIRARVYARLDAFSSAAWQPWLDVPPAWQGGQIWAQTSVDVEHGAPGNAALSLHVREGQWQWGENQLELDAARLYAQGAWSALARFMDCAAFEASASNAAAQDCAARDPALHDAGTPADAPLRFALQAAGLRASTPELFDEALTFDTLALEGQLGARADGAPQLAFNQIRLANADMDVLWQGVWHAARHTQIGVVDWHGQIQRLQASALHRYLPKIVSADARAWIRAGLLAGQLQNADFTLSGDLMHFPFGDAPGQGDFSLRGRITDGVIDYAASATGKLPWPRLDAIQGSLDMRRVALTLQADSATMSPAQGLTPITFARLHAHIPNIERDAQLTVQGHTHAPASSYLGLMRHSPLGERLDHVFAQSSGSGDWKLALTLAVPLLHSLDLTVQGEVRFADGTLQLMPEMPPFEDLNGTITFTHERITAPGLSARFLGDAVTIRGGIGARQTGLQFTGRVHADALRDYVGVQGMEHLQGQAGYTAHLQRSPSNRFTFQMESDLRGMALNLPAPLGKSADAALPLQVHWGDAAPASNTAAHQQALDVRLGSDVHLRLLRRPGAAHTPYFHAGALMIAQPMPDGLAPGMWVDVRTAVNDASAWHHVVDQFSRPLDVDVVPASAPTHPLLPDLRELRIQAERLHFFGLQMQDVTLHAARTDAAHWRIAIQSPQTEGTLVWRNASADVAGQVQARFERLALGAAPIDARQDAQHEGTPERETTASAEYDATGQEGQTLNIPALDLHVRAFTLYGHLLGEISLKGVQQSDAWVLESLHVAGEGAQLEGRGLWRLRGGERGLNLEALATVSDMGAYLAQMGLEHLMRQGRGSIQSQFFWRDLPWSFNLANLQGRLDVNLENGRFSRVNSRTARLLELLSIQSLQRLAHLDWNLDALMREGFPYDVLRGEITLQDGKIETHDYRVIGPVGTIVIGGSTNLQTRKQNLQAVVIPNLDMSGAALAAGIAINPVVGVGAFLTQWLLKTPIENAMALEYRVGGTWDAPEIEEVKRSEPRGEVLRDTP